MTADELAWQDGALCAQTDPDLFHPDGKGTNNSVEAKKICARCDVIAECLAWALRTGAVGTCGGTTDKERQRMRRAAA